jgi:hypothetical protein
MWATRVRGMSAERPAGVLNRLAFLRMFAGLIAFNLTRMATRDAAGADVPADSIP